MGRRHRDQQQRRRAEARVAARPARSRAARSPGVPPYIVDMLGILAIALAINFGLAAVGVVNGLLRIIVALIVGRVVVTVVRRRLEARR